MDEKKDMNGQVIEEDVQDAEEFPVSGHAEYSVSNTDISNKKGNYVFTVGNVGSGKSTLQNLLVYRLWAREDVLLDYANADGDHRHDKILDDWVTSMRKGVLPDRTLAGSLQEFSLTVTQKKLRPLRFNFLEISGEDIKSIVPTLDSEEKPKLYKPLVDYLKMGKERINKRFIFISDCEENRKHQSSISDVPEDQLFNHLLRYMLLPTGLDMRRVNILFVASKWDTVRSEYSSAEEYFKKNFPQTRAVLNTDRVQVSYIPFTVGEISFEEIDGVKEQRIVSLESKYMDYVIQWIYNSFTGNHLRGFPRVSFSLLDRIKGLFSA